MNDFDENDEYFSSEEVQELMAEIAGELSESADEGDENAEYITLTNEDGEEVDFLTLGVVEYQERHFIVLKPISEEEESNVILELIPNVEEGYSTFAPVDDDILYEVFDKFKAEHAGEFNFQ